MGVRGIGAADINAASLTSGLERLLEDVHATSGADPLTVVTAGHASGFIADVRRRRPELVKRIVFLNPTIRGPFPSAQFALENKGKNAVAGIISAARSLAWVLYQIPYFASGMHFLANYPDNIEHQLRSHVFVDEKSITRDAIALNQRFSRAGTCLPKAGFLVGKADTDEDDFVNNLGAIEPKQDILVIIGKHTPKNAQTALGVIRQRGIEMKDTPGMLRSFEEYPTETAAVLKEWLNKA